MIRHYKQGDEGQINSLFQEVFHKTRSTDSWSWKYINNPQNETVITVFEEGEEVVGHVALVPVVAKWFDEEIKVGARTDTMVSPRHQGKGIYRQLNEELLSQAKSHSIDFLYGYPAKEAKKLFIRYTGAKEIASIPRLMYINKASNVIASKLPAAKLLKPVLRFADKKTKNSTSSIYRQAEVTNCNEQFNKLWEEANDVASILIKRDADYLNWRYHNHPDKNYKMLALYKEEKLVGYSVLHIEKKPYGKGSLAFGTVVDMLANDQDVWDELVKRSLHGLNQADIIQTWALTHTDYFQALRKNGFIHKDNPMPLVGKTIDEGLPNNEEGFDIANWFITPGDVDSF
jgi:N-acetylglutamate synthase-like GNAT family acetyltransferase